MSILDQCGNPKEGEFIEQDIGGPLCFQGDYLAKGRELPKIQDGDLLIMHDTGGYTYSLYSRFNSIQAPGGFSKSCFLIGQVTVQSDEIFENP